MVSRSAVLFRGQEVAYRWEKVGDKRATDSACKFEYQSDVFDQYRQYQNAQVDAQ